MVKDLGKRLRMLIQKLGNTYHGRCIDHALEVVALALDETNMEWQWRHCKQQKIFSKNNKAAKAFNSAPPKSRSSLWRFMKFFSEKIPKDTSTKVCINRVLYSCELQIEKAPALLDFAVALKITSYLPIIANFLIWILRGKNLINKINQIEHIEHEFEL